MTVKSLNVQAHVNSKSMVFPVKVESMINKGCLLAMRLQRLVGLLALELPESWVEPVSCLLRLRRRRQASKG